MDLLSEGSINIDQGDPKGMTPLMIAVEKNHSHIVRILLSRGADVSIEAGGTTALHIAGYCGHLAAAVGLIKAGAEVDACGVGGYTPLHLAAEYGHTEVVVALIDAGADVNDGGRGGDTPLYIAAQHGRLGTVRALLRANANPLLGPTTPGGINVVPLNVAATKGHSKVVRELIQKFGVDGCLGNGGGDQVLGMAAAEQQVDIIAMLLDCGVVDPSGFVLSTSAGYGRGAVVKALLEGRSRQGPTSDGGLVGYVNCPDDVGVTPLFRSIAGDESLSHLISPKVVRLLIDAGADTSSAVRITREGEVVYNDTPLTFAEECLRTQQVRGGKAATEEQMNRLEAVRRLLLRVEVVRAVSWLWHSEPLPGGGAAGSSSSTVSESAANGTQLPMMLPMLRRRRRGVLLAPLFR